MNSVLPTGSRSNRRGAADSQLLRHVGFMQRFAWRRPWPRRRIPILVQDAPVALPWDDFAFDHAVVAARVTANAAAIVAAARPRAIAVPAKHMAQPAEDARAATVIAANASSGKAAALIARIATVRRIADPFVPVDVAASLAMRRLVVQPLLHAAAAANLAAASAAL